MSDELASVKGVVDLPSHDALEQAQSFLSRQGYTIVQRAGNSLIAERRASDQTAGQEAPRLTVSAVSQPEGGVRITVRGNDREGVQERQAAWIEWSESLPKKSETQTNEPEDRQRTIETPEVPLPPPPRVASYDVPPPSPPPRRGSSRLLVGSLVGCGLLSILGVLLLVALVVGVGIGAVGKAGGGGPASNEGETTNVPKKDEGSNEYIPLVLRVSGEQGTRYRCDHSNISDEGDVVFEQEEGVLGSRPVEYRSRILDTGISDPYSNFTAECVITDPRSEGRIKGEILVNEQVVASEETRPDPPGQKSSKSTRLTVRYGPYSPEEETSKGKKK